MERFETLCQSGTRMYVERLLNERVSQRLLERELQRLYQGGNTSVRYALREANAELASRGYTPIEYEHTEG